ncbi:MAG: hypothetical protein HRU18_17760, partial [Pseudoalteromonas sp.]|uniref:hypothetical protein n=1 Tax=Pseudoalteromonas sp. TaxID=53249 RepID=UPI001D3B70B1
MILQNMILKLNKRGVVINAENEELIITGNTNSLSDYDLILLKENKSEILKIISKKNTLQNEERGDTYIAPLTNQQRNIYFLESLSVEKNFYNV